MAAILRRHPFFEVETTVSVAGEVVVRAYQVIVWISLTAQRTLELDPATPRFPAVLDVGNNHNLSVREDHLLRWAGLDPASLPVRGRVFLGAQSLPLLGVNVWIHRNKPGQRDVFSNRPAHCVELPEGIIVYPAGTPSPARLPLLGLRSLVHGGLRLTLSSRRHQISLSDEP